MRFIFLTFLSAGVVIFLNPILPFWIVMIVIGVMSALVYPNGIGGFLGGGLGMGLTWLGQSIYLSISSGSSLPDRLGDLMELGSGMTLAAITGVVGFLLGAFSGWTGVLFRNMIQKDLHKVF